MVTEDYSSASIDMGRCVTADASRESARRYGSSSEMPPERSVQKRSRLRRQRDLNRGPLGPSSWSPTLYPLDHGDPFSLFQQLHILYIT